MSWNIEKIQALLADEVEELSRFYNDDSVQ
jgi:hypothetical protein